MMSISSSLTSLASNAFAPINLYLAEPDVVEICVNRPGEIFIERKGATLRVERVEAPEMTSERIRFMAERVAALSNQYINEANPLLSASLASGERIQVVLPPASLSGGCFTVRKATTRSLTLDDYQASGKLDDVRLVESLNGATDDEIHLHELLKAGRTIDFLRQAVKRRFSILVSGGTGTGKTTFLNALLAEIPSHERLVTIEDTVELTPPQANVVRLFSSRGEQSIANVSARKLLEASLRMRPDRILLGEVRGEEAIDLLQAINTGHPGSLTTIHANSPQQAYSRLALLILQGGSVNLSRQDIINDLKTTLPIVVQIERHPEGQGFISNIYFSGYDHD